MKFTIKISQFFIHLFFILSHFYVFVCASNFKDGNLPPEQTLIELCSEEKFPDIIGMEIDCSRSNSTISSLSSQSTDNIDGKAECFNPSSECKGVNFLQCLYISSNSDEQESDVPNLWSLNSKFNYSNTSLSDDVKLDSESNKICAERTDSKNKVVVNVLQKPCSQNIPAPAGSKGPLGDCISFFGLMMPCCKKSK